MARPADGIELDASICAFIEQGVVILVGTTDADRNPALTRAWAARALDGGKVVELFLPTTQSPACIANLRGNGRIAVTFVRISDYRAYQVKGRCCAFEEVTEEPPERVMAYWDALLSEMEGIGVAQSLGEGLWSDGLLRVRFRAEQCFVQTPGPSAGRQVQTC